VRDPLIHIGYHKTGSTWLQEKIFRGDGFGFAAQPNPLPADEAFVAQNPFAFSASQAIASFSDIFAAAEQRDVVPVISHERLSGDIGSGGLDSRMIADRLAESFPSARILICVREQRDMVMSVYKTEVRFNTFTIEERFRDRTVIERRRPQPSLDYFQYHKLISYYQKLFGRERVLVLPYEHLRRDALGFLSAITSFVDLPAPSAVPEDRVNPSSPAALLAAMRYMNFVFQMPGLRSFFSGPIEQSLAKRGVLKLMKLVGPLVPSAPSRWVDRRWKNTIEQLAGDRFAESNFETAELTGLDLASLGYMVASSRT
jgi:hypothetical protein